MALARLCCGQEAYSPIPPQELEPTANSIPAHNSLADSINTPTYLSANSFLVVGRKAKWVVIRRSKREYFVREKFIKLPPPPPPPTKAAELPFDENTRRVSYSGVVTVNGATKEALYIRAKGWFATTYKSSKNVIEADEKDALLVGKAIIEVIDIIGSSAAPTYLHYALKLSFKDGRYKYEMTNFSFQSASSPEVTVEEAVMASSGSHPNELAAQFTRDVDDSANSLIKHLQTAMAADGDW